MKIEDFYLAVACVRCEEEDPRSILKAADVKYVDCEGNPLCEECKTGDDFYGHVALTLEKKRSAKTPFILPPKGKFLDLYCLCDEHANEDHDPSGMWLIAKDEKWHIFRRGNEFRRTYEDFLCSECANEMWHEMDGEDNHITGAFEIKVFGYGRMSCGVPIKKKEGK